MTALPELQDAIVIAGGFYGAAIAGYLVRQRQFRNVVLIERPCRALRIGFRCMQMAGIRRYPKGEVPTRISAVKGNLTVLGVLLKACSGKYKP